MIDWDVIIEENDPVIWSEARRASRTGMDPEDLHQDVLIELWIGRERLFGEDIRSIPGMIRIVSRRVCFDSCEREKRSCHLNYGLNPEEIDED